MALDKLSHNMRLRINRKTVRGKDKAMNHQPRVVRAAEPESGAAPLVVDSATLMGGRRELLIRHGDDVYRLRITASNKLILTK